MCGVKVDRRTWRYDEIPGGSANPLPLRRQVAYVNAATGDTMRNIATIIGLVAMLAGCALIQQTANISTPIGQSLQAGSGDEIIRAEGRENLPNVLGRADKFGRTRPTAVADDPPKLDVTTTCAAAAQYSISTGRDKEACLDDESTAQATLVQNWSKYKADDKNQCVGTVKTGGPPSYVELLSCIEILRNAKQIREGDPLRGSDQTVESAPQSIAGRRR